MGGECLWTCVITVTHMMPAFYHGCDDLPCTFRYFSALLENKASCFGSPVQSGSSTRSQTLNEYIWNVFLSMPASVFNPVKRKVLFSSCCYVSVCAVRVLLEVDVFNVYKPSFALLMVWSSSSISIDLLASWSEKLHTYNTETFFPTHDGRLCQFTNLASKW